MTGMTLSTSRLLTCWTVLRISLEERLVYRADFALGTLMRFLPIVTQVLLWQAVFTTKSSGERIAGFSRDDFVAYFLLVTISRAFSSMPTLASGIAMEIRDGEIKKYLIQPIDMIGFLLLKRVAWKLVYYVVAFAPFALVFTLCRGFFPGWPPAPVMAAYVASLIMAFLLGFFLETLIGLIGFWFLEVSSLLLVYMLLNFILSGHMFPLNLLTPWPAVAIVFDALPFKYLAYFPTVVCLGHVEGASLVWGLLIQFSWVLFFSGTCRLAYRAGLKRYSGFGG
jgi:ABC-2 type transport system permease protein